MSDTKRHILLTAVIVYLQDAETGSSKISVAIVCVFDIYHSHTLSMQHRYVVYKYGLYLFTKQTYPSPVVNANLCFCCSYSKGLHICKHKDIEINSNSFSENRIGHFISEIRKQNNLFHRKQTNKPMTSSLIKQGLKEICTVLFLYLREIRNIQQQLTMTQVLLTIYNLVLVNTFNSKEY